MTISGKLTLLSATLFVCQSVLAAPMNQPSPELDLTPPPAEGALSPDDTQPYLLPTLPTKTDSTPAKS